MPVNIKSNIFSSDPNAFRPKPRTAYVGPAFEVKAYDYVGKPVLIDGWKFLVKNQETQERVAELFGGTAEEIQHDRYTAKVLSNTAVLDTVIVSLDASYKLFIGKTLDHHCDGVVFLTDQPGPRGKAGDPCRCPTYFADRKDAAAKGYGAKPDVQIKFKVVGHDELGVGLMRSNNWDTMAAMEAYIGRQVAAAEAAGGEAFAQLYWERVSNKAGDRTWQYVLLRDIKPLNDAVAEEAGTGEEVPY